METKTLSVKDYYVNYYGSVIDIKPIENKLYILFKSGSGSGGQSYWAEFFTTYTVYKYASGQLIECGNINEYSSTDKCYFSGIIDGQEINIKNFTADSFFSKIFKRD